MGVLVVVKPNGTSLQSLLPHLSDCELRENLVLGNGEQSLKEGVEVVDEVVGEGQQVVDLFALRNPYLLQHLLHSLSHLLDFQRRHVEPDELLFSLSEKGN